MSKQIISEEFKRMRLLAGLITENVDNVKNVDQALEDPKIQAAGEKLAQDPNKLETAMKELAKLGIDKNTLMKAAQAHSSGKDVGSIIDDKIEKVNEASGLTDASKILSGLGLGLSGLSLVGGGLPLLAAAVILGLAGAGLGIIGSKIDNNQLKKESIDIEKSVNEALAKFRKK